MDEILTTAGDLELEVNEDDIEEEHEDKRTPSYSTELLGALGGSLRAPFVYLDCPSQTRACRNRKTRACVICSSSFCMHSGMCEWKKRSAFDQVSEFDRGRIVAYRNCGLSFREIGSRVGRNQTTVMRNVTVGRRRVRRTDVVDHIHLIAALHVRTGKLCAWQ
ncbi:hypothetical protein TNCV_1990181 [Trichonephila clavipes]|nr:hypothetical protein TNCV_1990181 [Trichonephila clavipes]